MADPAETKIEPKFEAPAPKPADSAAPEAKAAPDPKAGDPPAADPAAKAPEPKAESEDWRMGEIHRLREKLAEERAKPKGEAKPAAEGGETEEQRVDRLASEKAANAVKAKAWSDSLKKVVDDGAAKFPDFTERRVALTSIVDPKDAEEVGKWNTLLQAAIDTGEPETLIHDLGADISGFKKIMNMTPTKMAVELERRLSGRKAAEVAAAAAAAAEAAEKAEPSGAPKPIKPVKTGTGLRVDGVKPDDPDRGMRLPKKDWFAEREKQVRERGIQ